MTDDRDERTARLTNPVSLTLVAAGGGLVVFGDGALRQFGVAYVALAVARVVLARWLLAPAADVAGVGWASAHPSARGEASAFARAAAALGIGAVLALYATVVLYGSNVPFWDEFVSTLKFMTNVGEMTWGERVSALLAGHYGHRIVTTRLAALVQWRVTGTLEFTQLMGLAFACLAGAAAAVYTGLRRETRSLALFAPFLLILFQPQYHQLTLWGFSVQHFSALLFEALAFGLLSRGTRRTFLWAMAAFIVAAFSFGNGMLVGPLGLAYLCVQRRDREALVWLGVTTVLAVLYFHNLGIGPTQGARTGVFAQAAYLLEFLGSAATLGHFTDFLGAMDARTGEYSALVWLARATGLLIVVGFAWLTWRRYWRQNFAVYGLLALTVGSAALAALHRTGADYASPFMSRYTMHSALALGLLYLAFIERFPQRAHRVLPAAIAVATAFCAGSYVVTVPYMKLHRGDMRFSAWMVSNAIYTGEPVTIATPFFDLKLLQKADEIGVYSPPIAGILQTYAPESAAPPASVGATARVIYRGENAVAQILLLSAPEVVDSTVGVTLSGPDDIDQNILALPIEGLSVHARLLRNSGYGEATHYAIAQKSPLPQ